jgi:hypothetical protein
LLLKILNWQLHYAISRKDASNSYVNVVFFSKLEWCKITKGIGSIPYIDNVLEIIKDYGKDLLEICTRTGSFKVTNLTLARAKFFSFFPDGDYKLNLKLYDEIDLNIFNFTSTGIVSH